MDKKMMETVFDLRPMGGPIMQVGWTPYGLKLIETEFIHRILGKPLKKETQWGHTNDIIQDIKNSPLDERAKDNLIQNYLNRRT